MTNFTKTDLINALADRTQITKAKANEVIDELTKIIREQTNASMKVSIPTFGSFSVKERAARTGRNPRTGEPTEIAARSVLTFKASKPAA